MLTIIFDLDDTLYSRTQPIRQTIIEFMNDGDFDFTTFNEVFQKNSQFAFERFDKKVWSLKTSHIYRIKETLRELNIDISTREAEEFQSLYVINQQAIKPLPNIIDILSFLHEQQIEKLILTNGPSKHQRRKVKNLGLDLFFKDSNIVISAEEGVAKPDKKIFNIVEKRFSLQEKDVWFIGDSYENDIVGGSQHGWSTIWFNYKKQTPASDDNFQVKTVYSSKELKQFLFKLLKGENE